MNYLTTSRRASLSTTNPSEFRRICLLIALVFFASFSIQAQSIQPQASLSNGVLTLPEGTEIVDMFNFDLSVFTFSNDQEMVDFMSQFNNEYFLFRCNPAEKTGIVMLRLKGRETWTREQWNATLLDCCIQKPIAK